MIDLVSPGFSRGGQGLAEQACPEGLALGQPLHLTEDLGRQLAGRGQQQRTQAMLTHQEKGKGNEGSYGGWSCEADREEKAKRSCFQ